MPKRSKNPPRSMDFRIAVVEETADNIYSIKFVLQSLGYEVLSFSALSRYLPGLRQFDPQLVIVDMMIPGDGGYRVIDELRSQISGEVPILAITAAAMKGGEDDVLEAGASDTLAKPYAIVQLQKKLKKLQRLTAES